MDKELAKHRFDEWYYKTITITAHNSQIYAEDPVLKQMETVDDVKVVDMFLKLHPEFQSEREALFDMSFFHLKQARVDKDAWEELSQKGKP